MGGGDLNLKKSWHPQTIRNVERVWKAEQKAEAESKKIEQLRKELDEERARESMQRHAVEQGIAKKKGERLDWMYSAAGGGVDNELYLLGKSVDKAVDPMAQENEEDASAPGASFMNDAGANTANDLAAKVRDDPLFLIKKKEEEKRKELLNNPVKMKQLKQMLQANLEKSKKKKKDKKRKSKKEKKEKRKKKNRHSESSEESSDETRETLKENKRRRHVEQEQEIHNGSHRNHHRDSHRDRTEEEDKRRKYNRDVDDQPSNKQRRHQYRSRSKSPETRRDREPSDRQRRDQHRSRSKSPATRRDRERRDERRHRHNSSSSPAKDRRHRSRSPSHSPPRQSRRLPSPERSRGWQDRGSAVTKKMDASEKEKRLAAMMDNAKWRDEQRGKNVQRYREEDARLEAKEAADTEKSAKFIDDIKVQSFSSKSTSSVSDRIRRNINSVQRTPAALESFLGK